jgi:hypothetical protein
MSPKEDPSRWPDDLIVWGARNIGLPINLTERATRHLIDTKRLPVKNHGGHLSARVGDLRRACSGDSK